MGSTDTLCVYSVGKIVINFVVLETNFTIKNVCEPKNGHSSFFCFYLKKLFLFLIDEGSVVYRLCYCVTLLDS